MSYGKYFPEWEKMTVREIRGYLRRRKSVIVPLGVTEQHGYHLPTCTDTLMAAGISKQAGARAEMIVAPALNMSFSGGQLPGTINVNPNVFGLLVAEVLRSLVAQGARNLFLVLGHGGSENFRSLDNSLKLLLRDDPAFAEVMLVFAPVWKFTDVYHKGFAARDWHAGYVETSMIMALAPELVQMDQLAVDSPELVKLMRAHPDNYQYALKPIEDEKVIPRMAQRADIKVGVMGMPEKATLEFGRRAVEGTVAKMAAEFLRLEKRRARLYREAKWTPEPIVL
jgi:creatinine amidohydrolase